MQLDNLQRAFLQGIFDPAQAAVSEWIAPGAITPARCLGIYRNNVFSNYRSALEAVYPVILRLVGEDFFRHAAYRFIERYPSASGDIHHFGKEFAPFLTHFPGTMELPYLADVARLEWAVHEVFHEADSERLDLSKLQGVAPEQYAGLLFRLNPASRLLESPYPVRRIWQVNQPDYQGEETVDLSEGGELLLVMRRAFVVELEPLSANEFTLLQGFASGLPFAAALDQLSLDAADFDAGQCLSRFVLNQAIVDFQFSPEP